MFVLLFAIEFNPQKHFSGAGFAALALMVALLMLVSLFCPSKHK